MKYIKKYLPLIIVVLFMPMGGLVYWDITNSQIRWDKCKNKCSDQSVTIDCTHGKIQYSSWGQIKRQRQLYAVCIDDKDNLKLKIVETIE